LFIAHDLAVVKHMADRVAVMYLGRIVEVAQKEALFANPRHPYTRTLLSAIPRPDPHRDAARQIPGGDVPSPMNPPPGCHFHTRCPFADARCKEEAPVLRALAGSHQVACHHAETLPAAPAAAGASVMSAAAARRLELYAARRGRAMAPAG
ncbi:MAG: ABC transporter ATP-binding protein, partial [Rhodospirillales bacterium]|nr:ABC transporter ATP-binding protein [Rhodospirillales bacterium]